MLFIAAEHCLDPNLYTYLDVLHQSNRLARFFVDEAHLTLTQLSFRSSMHHVHLLRRWPVPIVLLSATVPPSMETQLACHYATSRLLVIRCPVTSRPELLYSVIDAPNIFEAIVARIKKQGFLGKPGIVFCTTRNEAEDVASRLQKKLKVPCLSYHSTLDDDLKQKNQSQFMTDSPVTIMCATSAFGVGIDKANVAFVYHYGIPYSLLDYIQEAGRAARGSGTVGDCCLFTNKRQKESLLGFLNTAEGKEGVNSCIRYVEVILRLL